MDNQDQYSRPRRGRPPGPNRTPLSRSERRARNAEYERQRRELIGVGISRLEPLVGATPETPRAEVLVQTVCYINSARDSIESLRRENQELKDQIAEYQRKQRELLKRAAESSRESTKLIKLGCELLQAERKQVPLMVPLPQPTPEDQIPPFWLENSPPSSIGFAADDITAEERDLAAELFPGLEDLGDYHDENPPPD